MKHKSGMNQNGHIGHSGNTSSKASRDPFGASAQAGERTMCSTYPMSKFKNKTLGSNPPKYK